MQFFYPFMTVDKPRDRVYRGVEPSEIERGLRRVVSRDPYLRFEFVEIYLRDEFLDNDPDQLYIIENAEIRCVRSEKIILFFFRGTFLFLFFFFTDLEDLNRCMDVTEDQIRTAKEIFPSLFINYGRVLPEVVIARCIFENNFDSGIVSRSLDRKVKMVMG